MDRSVDRQNAQITIAAPVIVKEHSNTLPQLVQIALQLFLETFSVCVAIQIRKIPEFPPTEFTSLCIAFVFLTINRKSFFESVIMQNTLNEDRKVQRNERIEGEEG